MSNYRKCPRKSVHKNRSDATRRLQIIADWILSQLSVRHVTKLNYMSAHKSTLSKYRILNWHHKERQPSGLFIICIQRLADRNISQVVLLSFLSSWKFSYRLGRALFHGGKVVLTNAKQLIAQNRWDIWPHYLICIGFWWDELYISAVALTLVGAKHFFFGTERESNPWLLSNRVLRHIPMWHVEA